MKKLLILLLPNIVFAQSVPLTPFPVFLKEGFSSVLEFESVPTKVVLGDPQSFQVEKLNNSVVVKTLTPYATSNMFVYFKSSKPRLFILTASEDAEPTYYKKFETLVIPQSKVATKPKPVRFVRGMQVVSTQFDKKKDYLTIEVQIQADSRWIIKPEWKLIRLMHNQRNIKPDKLWSERQDIQKDSKVTARFIFKKPNLPRDMKDVRLVMPLLGNFKPLVVSLGGK